MTALVVEDVKLEADLLRDSLIALGFQNVLTAPTLNEALAILSTRQFSLVMLDLKLADSPAENTIRRLPDIAARADGAALVLCSGYQSLSLENATGYFDAVLQKPYLGRTVEDVVATVITSRQARLTGELPKKKAA